MRKQGLKRFSLIKNIFFEDCVYFIEFLQNFQIEKIEKGFVEELTDEPKKSDWELLQESSDDDYLRRTVMPLLHPVINFLINFLCIYININ